MTIDPRLKALKGCVWAIDPSQLTDVQRAEVEKVCDQPWDGNVEELAEAITWLNSRPDDVKAVIRQFPPGCVMRAKAGQKLIVPRPGSLGVSVSLIGHADGSPPTLRVVHLGEPDSIAGECRPEWLEVVAYWRGWTPSAVAIALGEKGN